MAGEVAAAVVALGMREILDLGGGGGVSKGGVGKRNSSGRLERIGIMGGES